MSALLELSSKLSEIKTEIKNILGTHNITVTDNDSIDYYLEKLKTLKIVNQNKKMMYAGNYKAEDGYSGFGDIEVDCPDGTSLLYDLGTNLQTEDWLTLLPKYNADNPDAEYIKNPYNGPSTISYTMSSNYTGNVVTNVRFNNVKKFLYPMYLNYTGWKSIVTLTFPDVITLECCSNYDSSGRYSFIDGSNSSNSIDLKYVYLPQLLFTEKYSCICRNLKELTTISVPNLKVIYGNLAYNCPKLNSVDLSNLEEIRNSLYADSSYYYIQSLIDSGVMTSINLPKLKSATAYYGFLLSRCQNITSLILPELETIGIGSSYSGGYLINDCRAIEYISLPKLKTTNNKALFVNFAGSSSSSSSTTTNALTTIHFKDLKEMPSELTTSNSYLCFPNLDTIILEGDNVLKNTSISWWNGNQTSRPHFYNKTAEIYVPNDLIDEYKRETNWSLLSKMIKPLSEYDDPYNLITRHNGYMDINITQDNCKTYLNNNNITPSGNSLNYSSTKQVDSDGIVNIENNNDRVTFVIPSDIEDGNLIIKLKINTYNKGNCFFADTSNNSIFGFYSGEYYISEYVSRTYATGGTRVSTNTWYWLKFSVTTSNIKVYLLQDNGYTKFTLPENGWSEELTVNKTNYFNNNKNFYLGYNGNWTGECFVGEIDLNNSCLLSINDYKADYVNVQNILNLPFYTDKSYNLKIENENYNTYFQKLKFNDITKKTINIDLDNVVNKTLTLTTNVQEPNVFYDIYGYKITDTNSLTVPVNTEITYKVTKRLYKPYEKTIIVNDNITENVELEYTGKYVDVDLTPGKTSYGWMTSTIENPKENEGWNMYQSINTGLPSSYSTYYATMKVKFYGYSTFKCYINGYGYSDYCYTIVSALDSESYSSVYNNYSTRNKIYPPETFKTPNWTEVTFTTNSPNTEHYFYVTYIFNGNYNSYNYKSGFLLLDQYQ